MKNQYKKIGLPRLLIVGCGDIGCRLLPWIRNKFRVYAVTTNPSRCNELRAAGAIPIVVDLDRISSQLIRLSQLADIIIHLAPPNASKNVDFRTRHLISVLPNHAKVIYISTTGVYGNQQQTLVNETTPVQPDTPRGKLRYDAEQALRQWAIRQQGKLVILRVAGIYAESRLPLKRIRQSEPVLVPEEDGQIHLIHADDLARIILYAIKNGLHQRVYNVCDDSQLSMGQYMTLVAQHYQLPLPPQMSLSQIKSQVSDAMLSYMTSHRHIQHNRLNNELGVKLMYPTVQYFLAEL